MAGVPLDSKQENTLSWGTQSEQSNYFSSKRIGSLTGTYQRKDSIIRYDGGFDEISTCNYVMYQNTNQSNKWYYAFVVDIEYINDSRTDLYIKTDVIQTYYFDINYKQCFVEREHVMNDTLGANTIPENLEYGDYVISSTYDIWRIGDEVKRINENNKISYALVFASSVVPYDMTNINISYQVGEQMTGGCGYFGFPFNQAGVSEFSSVLDSFASANKIDAIKCLYLVPDFLVKYENIGMVAHLVKWVRYNPIDINITCVKGSTIDGVSVRNNKLLCHPYNLIYATNNQGQNNTYKYEDFRIDNNGDFNLRWSITENSKPLLTPTNYKGSSYIFDEGISLPSYVQCNWSGDTFTAWLAQNGGQFAVNALSTVGSLMLAPVTGGLSLLSTFTTVASSMVQMTQASQAPPSTSGNSGGSTLQADGLNWFSIYRKTIKGEYARIIDNYFEMFGYKVNKLKIPDIRSRTQWNFVKTIECNISGNINIKDSEEIKSIFNNGVRFWRNPDSVGNFNLNNHEGVAK